MHSRDTVSLGQQMQHCVRHTFLSMNTAVNEEVIVDLLNIKNIYIKLIDNFLNVCCTAESIGPDPVHL